LEALTILVAFDARGNIRNPLRLAIILHRCLSPRA
jgi:hypothetical protein